MSLRFFPLLASLVLAGCSRDPASPVNTSPPATAAAPAYPLRGVVTDVMPAQSSLMVRHEEIPGFMPAMTMALKVEADVLPAAARDQVITATLYRREAEFWLRDVKLSPPGSAAAPAAPAATADGGVGNAEAGQAIYARICFTCHQFTGLGLPGAFPPLAGAEPVAGDPDRLIRIVLHGLQGPITVKGVTYASVMPPHGMQLQDQEIADVLTYVRGAWDNRSGPVSAAAVARVRAADSGRAMMWTWDELQQR